MKKYSCYVVSRGYKTGIFNSWAECKAAIDGYGPAARYRGFNDAHEAAVWYFCELGKRDEARQARRKQPKQKQTSTAGGAWHFTPASEPLPVLNPETWDGRIAHKWDEEQPD